MGAITSESLLAVQNTAFYIKSKSSDNINAKSCMNIQIPYFSLHDPSRDQIFDSAITYGILRRTWENSAYSRIYITDY